MGQKVNPIAVRLKVNRTWDSFWFSDYYYSTLFAQDCQTRLYYYPAKVIISHSLRRSRLFVFSKTNTSKLHQLLSRYYYNTTSIVPIKLDSVYQSAGLLAQSLCNQLEQHHSFRKCCKIILQEAQRFRFIQGIRIQCSGRLNGAEIAKTQFYHVLGTNKSVFSKRLDYAALTALTPYGCLGVKIWICYHHDHS